MRKRIYKMVVYQLNILLMIYFSPEPVVPDSWYFIMLYLLGGIHNFFSLIVTVTFFLASRPKPPDIVGWIKRQ